MITHYSDDDDTEPKEIGVDFGKKGRYEVCLLDKDHDGEIVGTKDELRFVMPVHSCVMIREV